MKIPITNEKLKVCMDNKKRDIQFQPSDLASLVSLEERMFPL